MVERKQLKVGRLLGERRTQVDIGDYINCCGIREISGLSCHKGPMAAMRSFCNIYPNAPKSYHNPYPSDQSRFRYAIFSQASNSKYGDKFATYIRNQKLGDVIETAGKHVNPNSGHVLKVFVWTVDHDAVKLWMKKEFKNAKIAVEKAPEAAQPPPAEAPGR